MLRITRLLLIIPICAIGCVPNYAVLDYDIPDAKKKQPESVVNIAPTQAAIPLPFPNRTNPFGESSTSANQTINNPLKDGETQGPVFHGIVEVDKRSAILTVRGESVMLQEGESHGDLRLLAILSDRVRINMAGSEKELQIGAREANPGGL